MSSCPLGSRSVNERWIWPSEIPDGDMPIEFEIVNRRTHEPMHYGPVPYRHGGIGNSPIPFIEMVQVLQMNLNIAANRLDTELQIECSRQRRESQ